MYLESLTFSTIYRELYFHLSAASDFLREDYYGGGGVGCVDFTRARNRASSGG